MERKITPYWRTLKADEVINEKYPGGIQEQIGLLETEGHEVMSKGKKNFKVVDFEKKLVK